VRGDRAVVERVLTPRRTVYDLVAQNEMARLELPAQRAGRTRQDHIRRPEVSHGPHVGAVVDPVWRDVVRRTVSGHEAHPSAIDLADHYRPGGTAVRRVDRDFSGVIQQVVEPAAAEYRDLDLCTHSCLAHPRQGRRAGISPQADLGSLAEAEDESLVLEESEEALSDPELSPPDVSDPDVADLDESEPDGSPSRVSVT